MIAVAAGLCAALAVVAALPGPPGRWRVPGWLPVAAPVAVLPWTANWWVPGAVVLAASYAAWRIWRTRLVSREAERTAERVLETCESMVGDLRAGHPPGTALARAAEEWPLLAPVASADRVGASVPATLRAVADTPGAADLRLLAAAWDVSHRTGHGLAAALQRVRTTLRQDRATARVVTAELASARATARLVACLPVVALLMGSGSGGDPLDFLFGSVAGWACLAGGLALGLLGLGWIEAIARGVLEGDR